MGSKILCKSHKNVFLYAAFLGGSGILSSVLSTPLVPQEHWSCLTAIVDMSFLKLIKPSRADYKGLFTTQVPSKGLEQRRN